MTNNNTTATITTTTTDDGEFLRVSAGIKGTCETVEKPYVRLTRQPDPGTIRPEHVLVQALDLVVMQRCDCVHVTLSVYACFIV